MSRLLFFVLCFFASFSVSSAQTIERTVSIAALKDDASRYFYLPFEVPAQTVSLTLTYEYDRKNGANVLDLGVFDASFGGAETDLRGFRGWSGGRRDAIFIAENSATNGYLAGKIPKGRWRVVFGLYKVAPEGVNVAVKIKFNDVPADLLKEPAAEENQKFALPDFPKMPAPNDFGGYRWFRGDLHVHTFHSDGVWTIPLIYEWASRSGLNFVGVTEHNTASHHAAIERLAPQYKNLLVLRGEEATTYGGHFNVWGLPAGEVVDFRVAPRDAKRLRKIVDGVHQLGLLASINHPFAPCGGCGWSYGDWQTMDAVEIWNGAWDFSDEAALKKWDEVLTSGGKIAAIGSSDSHAPPFATNKAGVALGSPTVRAAMKNLTQKDLLEAIRARRVWLAAALNDYNLEFSADGGGKKFYIGETAQISGKEIELRVKTENFPAGAIVSIISNNQKVFSKPTEVNADAFAQKFGIERAAYFRAEIRDATGKMLALTNPIFVKTEVAAGKRRN